MITMNKKEQSHLKYENLTDEQKNRLIEYAKTKLPGILQNNKLAVRFQIYKYIRSKL